MSVRIHLPSAPLVAISHDAEVHATYVSVSRAKIARTIEYTPNINLDLDADNNIVGVEIL